MTMGHQVNSSERSILAPTLKCRHVTLTYICYHKYLKQDIASCTYEQSCYVLTLYIYLTHSHTFLCIHNSHAELETEEGPIEVNADMSLEWIRTLRYWLVYPNLPDTKQTTLLNWLTVSTND
jgi:hypothetical protein